MKNIPINGKVTWFEIPTSNISRAQPFYKGLHNWEFQKFGEEMTYWMVSVHGSHMPIGGFYEAPMQESNTPGRLIPIIYFTVEIVEESIKEAQTLGGKVKTEKTAIPTDGGYFAQVLDLDNNIIGIWVMK